MALLTKLEADQLRAAAALLRQCLLPETARMVQEIVDDAWVDAVTVGMFMKHVGGHRMTFASAEGWTFTPVYKDNG